MHTVNNLVSRHRRSRFRGSGVSAALLALAACRSVPAELVIANGPDPEVLDPQLAASTAEGRILAALYVGLTRLDPASLQPEPALAERWETEEGGRRWRFHLRPGLRWSDGSPLRATDLVESWQRLRRPETAAPYRAWLDDLETLEASGSVLEVRFRQPEPAFDQMCAYHALAPRHERNPDVSCGPYRLVERRVRHRVRVERNPHYFAADTVAIGSIDFLTTDALLTGLNLFLAGDVHYVPDAPALALPALARRPEIYDPRPYFGTEFYRVNCRRGPLADARVRRALSLALDRAALAATVGGGQTPARSFTPPLCPPYQPPLAAGYDPGAAAALLAEAGFPGGAGLPPLRLVFPSGETARDCAEAVQDQWRRQLGVAVILDMQESAAVRAAVRAGDYDLARASWIGDYLDPATFLEVFAAGSAQNLTGWQDAQYQEALAAAAAAGDGAARLDGLRRAEARLLAEAPLVPLFHYATHELVSPRLRYFQRNSRQYIDWSRLALGVAER